MRAALTLAALAAGAIAVPFKRDVVYDMVYVTDLVTVTAGTPEATPVHHHHAHKHHHTTTTEAMTTPAPTSVYTPPASIPTPSVLSIQSAVFSAPSLPIASPPAAALPASGSYQQLVLDHHNMHRKNHSVSDLVWDDGLATSAGIIAASCVYAHNIDVNGGGYGQNIAAGVDSDNIGQVITNMFYNGEEPYFANLYGQASPDMSLFDNWGHFSQMVWKDTTAVACATQYCPGGLGNVGSGVSPYFTVCNYKNPGNFAGEYGANVLPPIGMATVTA